MRKTTRTSVSTPLGNVSPMDSQCNRVPRRAQFKVTKKDTKRAANRMPPGCLRALSPPTRDRQAAPIQALFLNVKQVDGDATTGEFSSLAATY